MDRPNGSRPDGFVSREQMREQMRFTCAQHALFTNLFAFFANLFARACAC